MKQFALFAGYHYYPAGGWDDYVQSFSTVEEAILYMANNPSDWWHVVDMSTGKIVA